MTSRTRLSAVLLALVAAAPAGCGDDAPQQPSGLGGDAKVVTLARAPIGTAPPRPAAWVAWRVELRPGEEVQHAHALSTVYAEQGPHALDDGSGTKDMETGGGAIVGAGRRHTHRAGAEASTFWDVLLDSPGAKLPRARRAERIFETEPLKGIPEQAEVAFLDVALPPGGGETTVHTHPGPETIYVTSGPFDYQNGIEGSSRVGEGDVKSIPPGTPVQKRNPGDGPARFLSWFIVDPAEEFAPTAEFPR